MKPRVWFLALLAVSLFGSEPARAAGITSVKEAASQAALRSATPEAARAAALAWLKSAGKSDPATLEKFQAVWSQTNLSILDRVADSFALGDARVAELLEQARDASAPAPTELPTFLKDEKQSAFFRSNFGLAYAKALSARRVDEEALEVLRLVKPSEVVDPAAYFFHRAVVEHDLLLKGDANRSIVAVLEDVNDAPERYKMLAILMAYDMQGWKEKDLGEIARKMDNIERRLALSRGGPRTQKIQKEVIARLDEIIKKLENQAKGCGS